MTRTRRPAGQRAKPITATAEGAWEDGKSEIESLKEELGDWKDNMEGNGMEHLPKFEEVSEAADGLEAGLDTLEGIEFPECLSDVPVDYTQDTRQSAGSRSGRMSNALNALNASKAAGESWLEENPSLELVDLSERDEDDQEFSEGETDDEAAYDQHEEARSVVEEFISQMDDAIGELENVNFPGMY